MVRRDDAQLTGGEWALPGGLVRIDEPIDATASRVLRDKAGINNAYLEQLYTYGAVDRDPRERVVSVTYFALMPIEAIEVASRESADRTLARIAVDWEGETGGPAQAIAPDGATLDLAFDHSDILGDVVKRLRGKLDYTPVALGLLPEFFTLREVQEVYEAILDRGLTKPAFRRKLLDRDIIKPTGRREAASAFRPAELYTRL
jgi:8-oxo-dGTP diphosphatase